MTAGRLLVGPFALPLLGAGPERSREVVAVPKERLPWLDAARPPHLGDAGDVVLWRDPAPALDVAGRTAAADDEVATMMQRWGYAKPAK